MTKNFEKMLPRSFPRRELLTLTWQGLLAASGLLATGGLLRFLGYQSGPTRKTRFELGLAEDYAPGSVTPIAEVQALLLNTPDGFVALSAICPHLGCQVESAPGGFVCPCHASRFDAAGALLGGPAQQALRKLRLEVTEDGQLILYLD
jgi:cytochrome b6-f complex iron-sulfur subunit